MSNYWKHKIKTWGALIKFKVQAISKNCEIGKMLGLVNSKYIILGQNDRIKDFYRIECYDQFWGQKLNPSLEIGNNVIIGYGFSALVSDKIKIEDDVIFASNVLITSHNHGINPEMEEPYHKQPLATAPVCVGKGSWIGEKVTILPGVTIGEAVVIAAGAVVSCDIPSYSIAGGIPARVLKKYNFEKHAWEKVTR